MNIEPYLPALTAFFTLLNTALVVWGRWQMRQVHKKVNGMYLQTLADAELRGRAQASAAVSAMAPTERALAAAPAVRTSKTGPSSS